MRPKYTDEQVQRLREKVLALGGDPRLWEDVTQGDHACWAAGVQLRTVLARLHGYLNDDGDLPAIAGVGKNGHIRAALISGMGIVRNVRTVIRKDRREAKKEGRPYPERLQACYEEIAAFGENSVPALMGKVTREDVLGDQYVRDPEAIALVVGLHGLAECFERTAGEEYHRAMAVMQAKNVLEGLVPDVPAPDAQTAVAEA